MTERHDIEFNWKGGEKEGLQGKERECKGNVDCIQ